MIPRHYQSTVVLNSRDRPENLWLPGFFALLKPTLQKSLAEKPDLNALVVL